MRALRPVMLCATVFGLATEARAAEPNALADVLRGSSTVQPARPYYQPGTPVYFRWEGLYFGGQFGRTESGADFSRGVASLVAYILRNDVVANHVADWTTLPKDTQMVKSYGAFIGYNMQFDQAVIGIELNYNRIRADHAAADSLTRTFNDDTGAPASHHYYYTATVTGNATATLTDYGTVRVRAAWEFGRILPYAFGGLAVGRGTMTHSATVSYLRTDIPDSAAPPIPPIPDYNFGPQTKSETVNKVFFGYAAGLGVDVAVLPNVFLRGEWEFIQFKTLQDVNIHLNTVRAAVGVRF